MSLLGMESWDIYGINDVTDIYPTLDANCSIVAGQGRCGSAALLNVSANGGGPTIAIPAPTANGGYFGEAIKVGSYHGSFAILILPAGGSGATGTLCFLRVLGNGSVEAWKGANTVLGTRLGATAAGLTSAGHYVHLGYEWKIASVGGYSRIYINGALQYDSGPVNMSTVFTPIQPWGLIASHINGYIDDLYWGDDQGSAPWNAFLGDCRVEGQLALTDAAGGGGFYRQFTPSSGTDHGALLNENPPNDGTTYVASGTVGQKETVKFPAITPTTGVVYGVQLMPNAVKTAFSLRQIATLVRSGGSDDIGLTQTLAQTDFKYYPQTYQRNPIGPADWTKATVDAMDGGITIVT